MPNNTRSNTIVYICSTGLGEIVEQTPLWKTLADEGKKVIVVLLERWGDAFRGLSFVDRLIEGNSRDVQYHYTAPDSVNLGPHLIEEFNQMDADIMTPLVFNNADFKGAVYCKTKPLVDLHGMPRKHPSCSTDHWGKMCGVVVSTYETFLAERKPITVNRPAVGVCIGSEEVFRRIPGPTYSKILDYLCDKFNIYAFGRGHDWRNPKVAWLIDAPRLGDSLDYIKQMDVFVTPDSGFAHVAVSYGIPTIVIQGREVTEPLFHYLRWPLVTCYGVPGERLKCNKDCHAKRFELNMLGMKRPSPHWLDKELWSYRSGYPWDLPCKKNGVDCMSQIDPAELEPLIRNILDDRTPHN
jgi:ADP-heptose:LPS heptosyltransferase